MKLDKLHVVILIFLIIGGCNQNQINNIRTAHSILEHSTKKENELKKLQSELNVLIKQENKNYIEILDKGKNDLSNINIELDKVINTNNSMLQKLDSMIKIMNSSKTEWVKLNSLVEKSENKQERRLLLNIISVLEERERIFFAIVNEQELIIRSNIKLYNTLKEPKVNVNDLEREINTINKKMDVSNTLNNSYTKSTKDLNNLKQIVYEIILLNKKK
ncbi:MAG: hypothetical protein K0S51_1603 [Bacillales bacterium]|jgi:hypothetical protein|nr:hypothetical protein [Bacillales bacterium]